MAKSTRRIWLISCVLNIACSEFGSIEGATASTGGTGTADCSDGDEGCHCSETQLCKAGLVCVLGQCRKFGEDPVEPAGSASGKTTAASTSDSGNDPSGSTGGESNTSSGTNESTTSSTSDDTEQSSDDDSSTNDSSEDSSEENSNESTSAGEGSTSENSEESDTENPDECIPHTTQCFSPTHIQTCNAQSQWDPPLPCIDQACVGNECTGVCFPGNTQCSADLEQVLTCSDVGQWGVLKTCIDQTCVNRQCQGECAPKQKRCWGKAAQSCTDTGMWNTDDPCEGPDLMCKDGECLTCDVDLVPEMTGTNSPSGKVTTSGDYNREYPGWKAFDANHKTMWISEQGTVPAWLAYDFQSKPQTIYEYEIIFSNGDDLATRAPRDWEFQAWNGNDWIPIDQRINEVGWSGSETRHYTIAKPDAYSKYRLYVTEDNDPRKDFVVISMGRLRLIGCRSEPFGSWQYQAP